MAGTDQSSLFSRSQTKLRTGRTTPSRIGPHYRYSPTNPEIRVANQSLVTSLVPMPLSKTTRLTGTSATFRFRCQSPFPIQRSPLMWTHTQAWIGFTRAETEKREKKTKKQRDALAREERQEQEGDQMVEATKPAADREQSSPKLY